MKSLTVRLKTMLGMSKGHARIPVELLFGRFKDVLDRNNRTLEAITEMAEKLSGDYLFDITYVKSAYSGLFSALHDSVLAFDALTQNKYPRLHEVMNGIDARIKKMLSHVSTPGDLVVMYPGISWDMGGDVGGKNVNLAEVMNYLRLNVPDAFAITTHAYDSFMKENRLEEKIDALSSHFPDDPLPSSVARAENKGLSSGKDDAPGSPLDELRESILAAKFPPALDMAIAGALEEIKTRCGQNCFLAVRSSAEEEDSDFSFAGQFETRLNVPADAAAVKEAYKEVIASLFSPKALAYQEKLGYSPGGLKMAVGIMVMVDAKSSGVMYSSDPHGSDDGIVINAVWGLGISVVEGQTDADFFAVKKGAGLEMTERRLGKKETMIAARAGGGTTTVDTPPGMESEYSLSRKELEELMRTAMLIERHFRKPQDIEWAIDRKGTVYILQARPLRINMEAKPLLPADRGTRGKDEGSFPQFVLKNPGVVVKKGLGAGKVFIVRHPEQLDNFPKGAVLVAGHDSSDFIRVMPYVSAIITDVGTPTSHMASLCREFRIPTVVNVGDATRVLAHGQEVTLFVDDDGGVRLYEGIRKDLSEAADASSPKMEELYEFRKKRYVLRYISPLNLVDPLREDFTPEGCKTIHDIIRFIHEKAVAELIGAPGYAGARTKDHRAVKLDIPIPAGITVIDIGGGLNPGGKGDTVAFDQIASIPFRAIVRGMMHPGVWRSDAVSLKVNDFLTSMIRMSDIVAEGKSFASNNLAVISRDYVNLSLRFGYHFTVLDCYCSENARNNHVYFRFVGGATDIVKRSRRVALIASVLREYGFNLKTRGDLIIARLANLGQERMEEIMDNLGRLIAYTRQLDAVLHDDSAVERYKKSFMDGNYDL